MPAIAYYIITALSLLIAAFYDQIIDQALTLAEGLELPEFVQEINSTGLPSTMLYFIHLFEINYGIAVIISASIAKMVYRRVLKLT